MRSLKGREIRRLHGAREYAPSQRFGDDGDGDS